ncbi:MAG: hypothetical protein LBB87_04145 [Nitrososphaerota archaeon]|nr:hypothetical protein [Nitrososphaerota archaeon]
MSTPDTTPLLFPLGIIFIAAVAITFFARLLNPPKQDLNPKHYNRNTAYKRYTPQFSPKMEIDMRLPYKQFKKLYPNNKITYDEYKNLQVQSAFKHSISSQQNYRMVR